MLLKLCIMAASQECTNNRLNVGPEMSKCGVKEYKADRQINESDNNGILCDQRLASLSDKLQCEISSVKASEIKSTSSNIKNNSKGLKHMIVSGTVRLWKKCTASSNINDFNFTANRLTTDRNDRYCENRSIHQKKIFDASFNETKGPFSQGYNDNNQSFKSSFTVKASSSIASHSYSNVSGFQERQTPFSTVCKEREGPFRPFSGRINGPFGSNGGSGRFY